MSIEIDEKLPEKHADEMSDRVTVCPAVAVRSDTRRVPESSVQPLTVRRGSERPRFEAPLTIKVESEAMVRLPISKAESGGPHKG